MTMTAPTAKKPKIERMGRKFATVSIPDLRSQQIQLIREEELAGIPPMAKTEHQQLEQIKEAINRSLENSTETTKSDPVSCNWLTDFDGIEASQLSPLVDSILEQYPSGGSPILSIAASDDNPQLASTVGRTAKMLQEKINGRVLMIDSDFDSGGLTCFMDQVGRAGLSDLVGGHASWDNCRQNTSVAGIDFVSIGRSPLGQQANIELWIGKMLPQLKNSYDYIMVCAGDAHSDHGAQWCANSNAAYLLVSMTESNQFIAKSAVTHLQQHGARLLGCVFTDLH